MRHGPGRRAGHAVSGLMCCCAQRYNLPARPPAVVEKTDARAAVMAVLPPLGLIVLVLGSILAGAATPTEAAGVGATGALTILGLGARRTLARCAADISRSTLYTTSMVF